ncbi:MAG: hypothetical protein ABSG65_15385, partial [Bryobacteraceae bacterium]
PGRSPTQDCKRFTWNKQCVPDVSAFGVQPDVCVRGKIPFPPAAGTYKPFVPSGDDPELRPLWSNLVNDSVKLKRWTDALTAGYQELLNRSTRDPNDPTGLLYQTWLHAHYCGRSATNYHLTWDFLPWHRAFYTSMNAFSPTQ